MLKRVGEKNTLRETWNFSATIGRSRGKLPSLVKFNFAGAAVHALTPRKWNPSMHWSTAYGGRKRVTNSVVFHPHSLTLSFVTQFFFSFLHLQSRESPSPPLCRQLNPVRKNTFFPFIKKIIDFFCSFWKKWAFFVPTKNKIFDRLVPFLPRGRGWVYVIL